MCVCVCVCVCCAVWKWEVRLSLDSVGNRERCGWPRSPLMIFEKLVGWQQKKKTPKCQCKVFSAGNEKKTTECHCKVFCNAFLRKDTFCGIAVAISSGKFAGTVSVVFSGLGKLECVRARRGRKFLLALH